MPTYAITLARSARKELERLGEPIGARVLRRIERLVIHAVDDAGHVLDISSIRHRSDAYR